MTYFRSVGGGPDLPWLQHSDEDGESIRATKTFLRKEQFEDARLVLEPLIARGNAEAQYLGSGFSWGRETEDEFDRRYIELLTLSAEQGFPPALFALGCHCDTGELVPENKLRAATLFKCAAEAGHAHSQWIHGRDLLHGQNGIAKDEAIGVQYIKRSAEAKFQGALETLAAFFETGQFGFAVDLERARELREQADAPDVIGY